MIHRLQRIVQEVNRAPSIDSALVMITESLASHLGRREGCRIRVLHRDVDK